MIQGCSPEPCHPDGPVVDCQLSQWTAFNVCTEDGQQERTRHIEHQAQNGGEACNGHLKETQGCTPPVQDCVVSDWTSWGECTQTCDGGQQRRHRQIHTRPSLGGKACPLVYLETQPCNTNPCNPKQDCELSDWSEWGACTATCGVGQQVRKKNVLKAATLDGIGCEDSTEQTRPCLDSMIKDCVPSEDCKWGDWSAWSGCTCDCGGGQKHRDRNIVVSPKGDGKLCEPEPKHEIAECNTQPCSTCQDAEWSEWGPWSECSATCLGGMKVRHRHVWREADDCGKPVEGSSEEYIECNQDVPCVPSRDCEFTEWSEWSACSCTCDGTTRRTRRIKVHGSGDGKFCKGHTAETAPCNPREGEQQPAGCRKEGETLKNCLLGEWSEWSQCDAPCGKGQQTKTREIVQDASGGGKMCDDPLKFTQPCMIKQCDAGNPPIDCKWRDWSDWGGCSKCSGQRARHRTPSLALNGGKPCNPGAARQTAGCPKDRIQCHNTSSCAWGDWEEWGVCTKTCGVGGERQRTRHLNIVPGDHMQRLYEENDELRQLTESLEHGRMQELVTAFSVGALSLVIVFAVVRASQSSTRTNSERRYERTGQDEHESLVQTLEIDGPQGSWQ